MVERPAGHVRRGDREEHGQGSTLEALSLGSAPARPRASSGRAWRLRAAQHSQGSGRPTGRPATASAARTSRQSSRRFHRLLVHAGKAKGSIFDALRSAGVALESVSYSEWRAKLAAAAADADASQQKLQELWELIEPLGTEAALVRASDPGACRVDQLRKATAALGLRGGEYPPLDVELVREYAATRTP